MFEAHASNPHISHSAVPVGVLTALNTLKSMPQLLVPLGRLVAGSILNLLVLQPGFEFDAIIFQSFGSGGKSLGAIGEWVLSAFVPFDCSLQVTISPI